MTTAFEDIDIFDRAVQRSREWLDDVCDALETDDTRYAYRLLKAYLHVVRDSLPLEDAARVSAQLPHLLRGVFYEGWDGRAEAPYDETAVPLVPRLADEAKLDSLAEAARATAALTQVFTRRLGRPPVPAEIEPTAANELIGSRP